VLREIYAFFDVPCEDVFLKICDEAKASRRAGRVRSHPSQNWPSEDPPGSIQVGIYLFREAKEAQNNHEPDWAMQFVGPITVVALESGVSVELSSAPFPILNQNNGNIISFDELGREPICGRPARCKRFLKSIGT
jgi:hypothetical protein